MRTVIGSSKCIERRVRMDERRDPEEIGEEQVADEAAVAKEECPGE